MLPIRQILVPMDWSEPSIRAFQIADSLAGANEADLILLHVVPLPAVIYGPPPESYLEHVHHKLLELQPTEYKTHVQHLLAEGDPATMILKTAKETNCDIIVMGTHGRSGLSRALLGSVAEQVVRKAPCLVLTVKSNCPAVDQSWQTLQRASQVK